MDTFGEPLTASATTGTLSRDTNLPWPRHL